MVSKWDGRTNFTQLVYLTCWDRDKIVILKVNKIKEWETLHVFNARILHPSLCDPWRSRKKFGKASRRPLWQQLSNRYQWGKRKDSYTVIYTLIIQSTCTLLDSFTQAITPTTNNNSNTNNREWKMQQTKGSFQCSTPTSFLVFLIISPNIKTIIVTV